VFFVATAPCLTPDGEGGHVNLSPKGYKDRFAVLGPRAVAHVDLTVRQLRVRVLGRRARHPRLAACGSR